VAKKLAFEPQDYAAGSIPTGFYAFAGEKGGYYAEVVGREIIANEDFPTFGYVKIHGVGNISTGGLLISLEGLRTLGFLGAKELYESLTKTDNHNLSGHYLVGSDIPEGIYEIQSLGSAYYSVNSGPIGDSEIIENDNFTGTKRIEVKNGQYLEITKARLVN